jgi:hypothetical protein
VRFGDCVEDARRAGTSPPNEGQCAPSLPCDGDQSICICWLFMLRRGHASMQAPTKPRRHSCKSLAARAARVFQRQRCSPPIQHSDDTDDTNDSIHIILSQSNLIHLCYLTFNHGSSAKQRTGLKSIPYSWCPAYRCWIAKSTLDDKYFHALSPSLRFCLSSSSFRFLWLWLYVLSERRGFWPGARTLSNGAAVRS